MGIRNLKLPTNLGFNVSEIEDITDQLPKNPAYTWAKLAGTRDPQALTDIVVHHTGVKKSAGCTAATHARNHINSTAYEEKGEPGIPYHIYINNGRIQQVNDLLDRTYGVASNNGYTVHIVTEGNFLYDSFTEIDRLALYAAILAVKAALPNVQHIKGHNEYNPTDCPAIDMNKVRQDMATIEQKMAQSSTWEGKMELVAKLYNQYNFMSDLIKVGPDDGNAQWAMNQLLEVVAIMKAQKLL